jgi:3'-5' exoribonuclease
MHKPVKAMEIGSSIESELLVTEKSLTPKKNGEYFLRLQLADITGAIKGVIWENGAKVAQQIQTGDVVYVKGEVVDYNGPQLVVRNIVIVPPERVDRSRFQRMSKYDITEMVNTLQHEVSQIKNMHLRNLLSAIFADEQLLAAYATSPAGKSVHHSYVGGLLEHSLEVLSICKVFVSLFPRINSDFLYSGALLHDIGKISDFEFNNMAYDLTATAKLLGHITVGTRIVDKYMQAIPDFPSDLNLELTHMLIAHHGQKEWGSPEVPKTLEAYALSYADMASAKINQFIQILDQGADNHDAQWIWAQPLERNIYGRTLQI